jgi:hypothetical protein
MEKRGKSVSRAIGVELISDFLLYLSSFRAECIVVSGVVFITFCLQKYATFYVRVARMDHVSAKSAPGDILQ